MSLLALALGTLSGGCHRSEAPVPGPAGPVIAHLLPASGPAGESYPLRVTIDGTGFAVEGNIVRFGAITVGWLESESPTRIVFFAPKAMPSTGEVPPMVLMPGDYPVTVQTPIGISAPAVFSLTRGP